jgi:Holliday junction resolvase RusA-like endonuclease
MKLIIKGEPMAKQSFRFTMQGRKYPDKEVKEWAGQARAQIEAQLPQGHIPYQKGVIIKDLTFAYPVLKNTPGYQLRHLDQGGLLYKKTKPDLDNLQKNLFDACKGVVFLDDSQIVEITNIKKIFARQPEITFEIVEQGVEEWK